MEGVGEQTFVNLCMYGAMGVEINLHTENHQDLNHDCVKKKKKKKKNYPSTLGKIISFSNEIMR